MVSEMVSYVVVVISICTMVWCRRPSVRNSTPDPPIPSEAEVAEVADVVVRVSASCAILSGVALILPGRVVTGVGDAPREEGKTVQPERQDAPDEEEAEHEREADDVRDKAREIAGVDATIKSVDAEIEFDVGSNWEIWLLSPSSTSAAKSLQPLQSSLRAATSVRRRRCCHTARQTYCGSRSVEQSERLAESWGLS